MYLRTYLFNIRASKTITYSLTKKMIIQSYSWILSVVAFISLVGLNILSFPNSASLSTLTLIVGDDLGLNFTAYANVETLTIYRNGSDAVNSKMHPVSVTNNSTNTASATARCQGSSFCLQGEVVKVVNGKSLYINVNNKIVKVDLALISLPLNSERGMLGATTFTRNTCLGSNVLVDHDDRQRITDSMPALVYCSPSASINEMLLQSGYAKIDGVQCATSEFSILGWAKTHGC